MNELGLLVTDINIMFHYLMRVGMLFDMTHFNNLSIEQKNCNKNKINLHVIDSTKTQLISVL